MWYRILLFIIIVNTLKAQSLTGDTLTVATYRYADNNRIKNIAPFANWFSKISNRPVAVKSFDSVHALLNAMKENKADIIFINTFGYLLSTEKSENYAIAAALHLPEDARSTYQTMIVASTSSRVTSLESLSATQGMFSLLLVNPGSTSGNLIPRLRLAEAGITEPEKFFRQVVYTGNHALTLQQVAEGKADIGAFGSEEFYKAREADSHLNEKVKVLWESEAIPLGPVLFRKDLDAGTSALLVKALLNMHREQPDALSALKAGWTEAIPADKFQIVDKAYYSNIIKNDPVRGMNIIRAFAR